jgi:hypothetical protein
VDGVEGDCLVGAGKADAAAEATNTAVKAAEVADVAGKAAQAAERNAVVVGRNCGNSASPLFLAHLY